MYMEEIEQCLTRCIKNCTEFLSKTWNNYCFEDNVEYRYSPLFSIISEEDEENEEKREIKENKYSPNISTPTIPSHPTSPISSILSRSPILPRSPISPTSFVNSSLFKSPSLSLLSSSILPPPPSPNKLNTYNNKDVYLTLSNSWQCEICGTFNNKSIEICEYCSDIK